MSDDTYYNDDTYESEYDKGQKRLALKNQLLPDLAKALNLIDVKPEEWDKTREEERFALIKAKFKKAKVKYHPDSRQKNLLTEAEKLVYTANFQLINNMFGGEGFEAIKSCNTPTSLPRFGTSSGFQQGTRSRRAPHANPFGFGSGFGDDFFGANDPFGDDFFYSNFSSSRTPPSPRLSKEQQFQTAVDSGDINKAQVLFSEAKYDLDLRKTMLNIAAKLDRPYQRQVLNDEADNVVVYAIEHQHIGFYDISFLKTLIGKCKFSDRSIILNQEGKSTYTPLGYACVKITEEKDFTAEKDFQEVMDMFLKNGASLTMRDSQGRNVLDIVIKHHPEMIPLVLLKVKDLPFYEQEEFLSKTPLAGCVPPQTEKDAQACSDSLLEAFQAKVNAILKSTEFEKHYGEIAKKNQEFNEADLTERNSYKYSSAHYVANRLLTELDKAKATLLNPKGLDVVENERLFKAQCIKAINKARPVLETHRGWSKLLAGFLLALVTLPISLPLYALGLFKIKTDSANKLDAFENDLKSDPPKKGA